MEENHSLSEWVRNFDIASVRAVYDVGCGSWGHWFCLQVWPALASNPNTDSQGNPEPAPVCWRYHFGLRENVSFV